MEQNLKQLIATGAAVYATQKKLANNDVARLTGINAGYISNIFRGNFTNEVNGKVVPIGDKHFHKLADLAGISVKKQYWKTIATRQLVESINTLEDAKENSRTAIIIDSTGMGKTLVGDTFCIKKPLHTYRLTVSSLYKLNDIINELAAMLGVDFNNGAKNSQKTKVDMIADRLKTIHHNGGRPIIIIDESENLKTPVINMLKGLYDGINSYCSIVLIGTKELLYKLTHDRKGSTDGKPQFFRRFKAGLKVISPLEKSKDFKVFFESFVQDSGLQKLLTGLCENYGELHDYLVPALRQADEKGLPLTEDLFRIIYNLPKY